MNPEKSFHSRSFGMRRPLRSGGHSNNTVMRRRGAEQAFFENYRLRIAGVIRDYGMFNREQVPADSKEFHFQPINHTPAAVRLTVPGENPVTRLKVRLKAASDS